MPVSKQLVATVRSLAASRSVGSRTVVLIDGRSGSGKSTLALALKEGWAGAQLVRLDDVYPGWDGLAAASDQVVDSILAPTEPAWRRWDWAREQPAEWNRLDPSKPLIVEGVGALTRRARAKASLAVWVELADAERRARALARDRGAYEPYWDMWAAQEALFLERENPKALADLIVDGEDWTVHDSDTH